MLSRLSSLLFGLVFKLRTVKLPDRATGTRALQGSYFIRTLDAELSIIVGKVGSTVCSGTKGIIAVGL